MNKDKLKHKLKIPKLRFKEFSWEWEEKEFWNIANRTKWKYNPKTSSENHICIELESIEQNTWIILNTFNSVNQESIKNIFKKWDVLYSKLRPYLNKYYYAKFDWVCSSEIWVLNWIKTDNKFLYYLIQTSKFSQIANTSFGSKMPRSDWDFVSWIPFWTPQLSEQQKIADFLTAVDEKIGKIKEEKELLEKYKKWAMQKIFSQELRFKSENWEDFGEWEEKKLGEIWDTYNWLSWKTAENFWTWKPFITYKQIFENSKIDTNKFALVDILEWEKQNTVQFWDILFTVSSETPFEVWMSSVLLDNIENDLYLNSFCFWYRIKSFSVLLPEFSRFYFRISNIRKKIIILAQWSTRYNISKNEMMKIKIKLPSIKEQQKIAKFLTSIDEKIEKVWEKLEKMEEFKKGLLQGVFI